MSTTASRRAATMPIAPVPGGGVADADVLFRTKRISEIRSAESATRREISAKEEELRQLVGRSYRDLCDPAELIPLIKQSSDSISDNLSRVSDSLSSLSPPPEAPSANAASLSPSSGRARFYVAAARAKYLVDTPEHIWGWLDEGVLLEAAGRYTRTQIVHRLLSRDAAAAARFPLLAYQVQLVEASRSQIAQRARERLADRRLSVESHADALATVAAIDGPSFTPSQALLLFLSACRAWLSKALAALASDPSSYTSVLCDVARIIRVTLGHVGQLFVPALTELPLFYKTVLESPRPAQLFDGIPDPDEETLLWREHWDQLEATMVLLEPDAVAQTCTGWLKECCAEIFGVIAGVQRLVDGIGSGEELASVQRLIRETLDGRKGLEGSVEQWLKSVFGSEIESPWDQIRGLILKEGRDIFEDWMEEAFVRRMKDTVQSEFDSLGGSVNVMESIDANAGPKDAGDFLVHMRKASTGGSVWFSEPKIKKGGILAHLKPMADENDSHGCLDSYLGPEVSRIMNAIDSKCQSILEDLLIFVESHNSVSRLKELVPYLQEKCYRTILGILNKLEAELGVLSDSLDNKRGGVSEPAASVAVERSLFIGRLLFALRYHSIYVPLILCSPRQWVKDSSGASFARLSSSALRHSRAYFDSAVPFTPRRHTFDSPRCPGTQLFDSPRRQPISAASLFGADDSSNPRLDELNKTSKALCITAHTLWITWVTAELSNLLSYALNGDDSLASATPLRGWEVTFIKQEEPTTHGPLEIQIALPSMPSLYIISFLYQSCLEIHKIGGHILDRIILQNFAWELVQKSYVKAYLVRKASKLEVARIRSILQKSSSQVDVRMRLINTLRSTLSRLVRSGSEQMQHSSKFRNIEYLSMRYEPYLRENEKQSYKRCVSWFN